MDEILNNSNIQYGDQDPQPWNGEVNLSKETPVMEVQGKIDKLINIVNPPQQKISILFENNRKKVTFKGYWGGEMVFEPDDTVQDYYIIWLEDYPDLMWIYILIDGQWYRVCITDGQDPDGNGYVDFF